MSKKLLERYQLLLEGTNIGLWDWEDVTKDEVWWSDALYRLLKIDPSEPSLASKFTELMHPEDKAESDANFETLVEIGGYFENTYRLKPRGDNKYKWYKSTGIIIKDDQGNLQRMVGAVVDVDELYSVKTKLEGTQRKLNSFYTAMETNYIMAKTLVTGELTYVNELFEKISGYSNRELLGKNHAILSSGHHTKEFYNELWNTILSGNTWRGDIKNRSKSGKEYWVDTIVHPIRDSDGIISEFISFSTDITGRKQQSDKEVQMARFSIIGESTSQIIHDVMTPLTVIQAGARNMNRLLGDGFKPEEFAKYIKKINVSVERIQSIFQNMRNLLKGQTKLEMASLHGILNESFSSLEEYVVQNDVKVKKFYENEHDFNILGSKGQLVQVFVNIIKNGIQEIAKLDARWITVRTFGMDNFAFISVTDSGEGIAPEIQDKIFDNLFTTKTESGGTGLGLGLCKKVLLAHGGDIYLDQKSANTSFIIKIPIA